MDSAFPQKRTRVAINIFFLYVGAITLIEGFLMIRLSRGWTISDWLINYQGGFVRRGLMGEINFHLAHLLHITPVFFAVLDYLTLYAVFFWAVRKITLATSYNIWILALLISPATLSLQILGPQAGFHKELIYLASFAVLALLLKRSEMSSAAVVGYLSVVLVVGTLSHELTAFYCPYFVALLILSGRTPLQAIRLCVVPFALTAIAFYFCLLHPGNFGVADEICSSLGYKLNAPLGLEICASGAIPYLTKTKEIARADTWAVIQQYGYFTIFPLFGALAIFPALGETVVLVRSGFRRESITVWAVAAISFLASIGLFVYAVDWGRWIYLHVMSISILLMLVDAKAKERQGSDGARSARTGLGYGVPAAAFLFVYGTFWIMPHASEKIRPGYIGRLQYLAHFSSQPKNEQRGVALEK